MTPVFVREGDAYMAWIRRCNAIQSRTDIERRLYDRVDADLMTYARQCIQNPQEKHSEKIGQACCALLAQRLTAEEYQIFETWAYALEGATR